MRLLGRQRIHQLIIARAAKSWPREETIKVKQPSEGERCKPACGSVNKIPPRSATKSVSRYFRVHFVDRLIHIKGDSEISPDMQIHSD